MQATVHPKPLEAVRRIFVPPAAAAVPCVQPKANVRTRLHKSGPRDRFALAAPPADTKYRNSNDDTPGLHPACLRRHRHTGGRRVSPTGASRWGMGMPHRTQPLACRRTCETGGAAHGCCPTLTAPGSPLEIGRGPRPAQSDGWGQPNSRRGSAVSVGQHTGAGGKAPARRPAILRGGFPVSGPRLRGMTRVNWTNERKRVRPDHPRHVERRAPARCEAAGWGNAKSLPVFWGDQDPVDALHASIRHLARTLGSLPAESAHRAEFAPSGRFAEGGSGWRARRWQDTSADGRNAPASECRHRPMPRVKNVPSGDICNKSAPCPPAGNRGPLTGRRWTVGRAQQQLLRLQQTVGLPHKHILWSQPIATYVAGKPRACGATD